jgi:hypothetical protein
MKPVRRLFIVSVFISFIAGGTSHADEVLLENGDHITGTVVQMTDGKLKFKTDYAGEISIDWNAVANIQMEATATVLLDGETSVQGFMEPSDPETMKIRIEKIEAPVTVDMADVTAINPPPPPPVSTLTARANFGIDIERGNTDSDEYHLDAQVVARSGPSRFTLGAEYDREFSEGTETDNKNLTYFRYDYFLTKKFYLNAFASTERDEFAALASRSIFGAGAGYQFYDTERTKLSLEAGLGRVAERYDTGGDDEFRALRFSGNLEHDLFREGGFEIFHWDEFYVDIEDSDNYFFRTRTGFRYPLVKYLQWTLEYRYDYDSVPAPGEENFDSRLLATIGFRY